MVIAGSKKLVIWSGPPWALDSANLALLRGKQRLARDDLERVAGYVGPARWFKHVLFGTMY